MTCVFYLVLKVQSLLRGFTRRCIWFLASSRQVRKFGTLTSMQGKMNKVKSTQNAVLKKKPHEDSSELLEE